MVNDVWIQLGDTEREWLYTYAKRDFAEYFKSDIPDAKYFNQMLARYNPTNQYKVFVKGARKASEYDKARFPTLKKRKPYLECYKWDDKYYANWCCRVADDLIKEVEHLKFRTCTNDCCMNRDTCKRFVFHKKGDDVVERNIPCKVCSLYIETTQL